LVLLNAMLEESVAVTVKVNVLLRLECGERGRCWTKLNPGGNEPAVW